MESDAAINSLVAGERRRVPQDPVGESVSIFRRLSQASFVGIPTMKKNKGAKPKTKSEGSKAIQEPNPDAGGSDLSPTELWVAVPPPGAQNSGRKFQAFTKDLLELVQWLVQCGVRTVAMEATGVYWIPLYQLLEDAKIKVRLVNARHGKNIPGRKSDVGDCQWLQYLLSVGLLRGSFRPAQAVCAARSIWRYRQELISTAGQYVQHMQAASAQAPAELRSPDGLSTHPHCRLKVKTRAQNALGSFTMFLESGDRRSRSLAALLTVGSFLLPRSELRIVPDSPLRHRLRPT